MIKKSFLIPFLFIGITFQGLMAQQDAQYTQYMYNTMSVNPAYAGSRGQLSFAGLYRSQWVGLDGAPETFTLNLHSPIRNSRLGYGISIVNDNIGDGVVQETYLDAAISYTIQVAMDAKLSFGLKLGGNMLSLDFNGLRNFDEEVVSQDNIDNKFNPNFGLGVYYHTDRFYAGLSAPNVLESEYFDNDNSDGSVNFQSAERINLYLITGYVFDMGPDLKFKPALLTKAVGGAPLQVDLSASFLFADKFSFGAAYRWDAALSGLVGFQLTEQLMVGLAYDRETTELGGAQFNDGSFEIFLRLELLKRFQRTVSPRFF
ncbi:type IX secretion system membrane protein PorP/SprF [Flagellimonas taeanensis]|jgi:type IX secretion system PorP/SprF family membrane protein|uniref:Type IX secretion system membrane protein, PorP/SprF family n=1 Tax=Flagellimonas taeanensis TaxID=1005926 RepID=A0A1M6W2S4_9FLAO|nr:MULTISPECIES: type IX secretion system membrane protein PorP/SprF [Allomuricauda]MDC6384439.1 type IX secretion system membrane protein PorP/SprF [Muricauda sp. SK9]MEE1962529.1 type IX secretion system membrane protein PorP/SprF [Allomuricauda taeanensis]RIV49787.1 type IX secretion system membrane protein PorP/SprF [Allomuricauda taeanensis]SFC57861.1 type IX secretion system membrane protein, PorP/SprF family [Allomuricauda taeanensis]SHK87815.1 type IX secretion system membrane protein,